MINNSNLPLFLAEAVSWQPVNGQPKLEKTDTNNHERHESVVSLHQITNPLLSYSDDIQYSKIQAKDYIPALSTAIQCAEYKLEKILEQDPQKVSFENSLHALIDTEELVARVVKLFHIVLAAASKDLPAMRATEKEAVPLYTKFFTKINSDPEIYKFVKEFANSKNGKTLEGSQKRYLEKLLVQFKLSGAELKPNQKKEFDKIVQEARLLQQDFENNYADSQFELILTEADDIKGLPEPDLEAARKLGDELREKLASQTDTDTAKEKIPENSYVFNLDDASYTSFMTYADSSSLRRKLFEANANRATNKATRSLLDSENKSLDNRPIIEKLLEIRNKKAKLLGFNNFAEYALVTKMAESPEQVKNFLEDLGTGLKKLGDKRIERFRQYQKSVNYKENNNEVAAWDFFYLSNKVRQEDFNIDEYKLKQHFELEECIRGMFNHASQIYGVKFIEDNEIDRWDPSVKAYRVVNKEDDSPIGKIFLDLFQRHGKVQTCNSTPIERSLDAEGNLTQAQTVIFCPYTKAEAKTFLTHDEVNSLFHEFGHATHHLFSKAKLASQTPSHVAWDFIELPSKLNENFTWDKDVLQSFAKLNGDGEVLNDDMISNMNKSKKYIELIDYYLIRASKSIADIEMHQEAGEIDTIEKKYNTIINKYNPFDTSDNIAPLTSFHHAFGNPDSYAAGFYSYLWADSLAADCFDRFKEEGVFNPSTGNDYRSAILEAADTKPAEELVREFRGREPNNQSFLKLLGLNA